jgi:hypothetical protein
MYAAVPPAKDHVAVICSTEHAREDEVDGHIVLRTPSEVNVDLVSAVGAATWTDTHVTFTHAEKVWMSRLDFEHEVLERLVSLCPPGHKVKVQLANENGFTQAKQAAEGTINK